ncbi:MAG: hypothetical protein PUC28_13645 [Blautia sp.]|nr:hypothetical protein [Blautia sp.]
MPEKSNKSVEKMNLDILMGKLKEQGAKKKDSDGKFAALVSSIENLAGVLNRYYGQDGAQPVVLDQAGLTEVRGAYERAWNGCNDFLGNKKVSSGAGLKSRSAVTARIRECVENDFNFLGRVRLQENMTLPELLEQSRNPVIRVEDNNLSRVGANMSSRIPLEIRSENGVRQGFFTEGSELNVKKSYQQVLENLENSQRNESEAARSAASRLRNYMKQKSGFSVYDSDDLRDALMKINGYDGGKGVKREWVITQGAEGLFKIPYLEDMTKQAGITAEELSDPEVAGVAFDFVDKLSKDMNRVNVLRFNGGIRDGSQISDRNVGMSVMARLLGTEGVLAHSEKVTLLQNGAAKTGVFMEKAEGSDCRRLKKGDPLLACTTADSFETEGLKKDLADIQVLDYICGNTDRHPGNLFYKTGIVDGKTKVVGVVGIDNDNSFGVLQPDDIVEGLHVHRPEHMLVMRKETADRVKSLTKPMLEVSLRHLDLTKAQIDAAWERTEYLQREIVKGEKYFADKPLTADSREKVVPGYIRQVEDADWDKISFTGDLRNKSMGEGEDAKRIESQFDYAEQARSEISWAARKINRSGREANTDEPEIRYAKASSGKAFGSWKEQRPSYTVAEAGAQVSKMKEMLKGLKDADHFWLVNSGEFKDMKDSISDFVDTGNKMIKGKEDGEKLTARQSKKLYELSKKIEKASRFYVEQKDETQYWGHGQKRYALAKQIVENASECQRKYEYKQISAQHEENLKKQQEIRKRQETVFKNVAEEFKPEKKPQVIKKSKDDSAVQRNVKKAQEFTK